MLLKKWNEIASGFVTRVEVGLGQGLGREEAEISVGGFAHFYRCTVCTVIIMFKGLLQSGTGAVAAFAKRGMATEKQRKLWGAIELYNECPSLCFLCTC